MAYFCAIQGPVLPQVLKIMKKKDLEKFKKLLLEEKKKVVRHLEELSSSAEEELQSGSGDDVDIASLEISLSRTHKIGRREAGLVKKIDYALGKIDEGTYGECENCGEDIAVARLQARPVAQLCIDCKTEQENNERRYTDRDLEADGDSVDDSD